MRHLNFLKVVIVLLISTNFALAQTNQSDGGITSPIINPSPQFGGQEIFRFKTGLMTQLDDGSFGIGANDRWFSMGSYNFLPQTSYGLRFQVNQKALLMGYEDIGNINPRILWVGEPTQNLGNLEFRVSTDFGLPFASDLVATMRNDGSTIFGPSIPAPFGNDLQVGIYSQKEIGLEIYQVGNGTGPTHGILVNNSSNAFSNIGISANVQNGSDYNTGVLGRGDSGTVLNIGVYGVVGTINPTDYAGYFDGNVFVSGTIINPSDKKLKKNIKPEKSTLEKLNELRPVTFNFRDSEKINLSQGLQHGFIAQEFEETFPELVHKINKPVFDEDGSVKETMHFKSINYSGLISILARSVQELSMEVDSLRRQLAQAQKTYVVLDRTLNEQELENIKNKAYVLEQNIPNPYSGQTIIGYKVPKDEKSASIMVFDMMGHLLKTYKLDKPEGQLTISAEELDQGIFLYSLVSNGQEIITKRMIIE